ncbi:MAG: aminopeptidase P family N-terminal domain-containing protein, partial [Pseudomonadota bacterium]
MTNDMTANRPEFFMRHDGGKAKLPFSNDEYQRRLSGLRAMMAEEDVPVVLLTSMHNIAYYSGFLYCAFGRPYACVVTQDACTTVSANIDASQPWRRSFEDNVIYTDWKRDNYWRAVKELVGAAKLIGIEGDHFTLQQSQKLADFIDDVDVIDIARAAMRQRMVKSREEIDLIRHGAAVADIGGMAIRDAIKPGAREVDIAAIGRNAMESEIARRFPDAEYRDTWVWFQSGINTDGAHNPLTSRALEAGDILSLNTFPMISGYYTALERTLLLGEPDAASMKYRECNVEAHELGLSLI